MCFFWNGSYTTAHFFDLTDFFYAHRDSLDKSLLFHCTILSGSCLPGKISSLGHLFCRPVLMKGGAKPCHVTAKVGVVVLISTFFKCLRFGTETLMFAADTAFFIN